MLSFLDVLLLLLLLLSRHPHSLRLCLSSPPCSAVYSVFDQRKVLLLRFQSYQVTEGRLAKTYPLLHLQDRSHEPASLFHHPFSRAVGKYSSIRVQYHEAFCQVVGYKVGGTAVERRRRRRRGDRSGVERSCNVIVVVLQLKTHAAEGLRRRSSKIIKSFCLFFPHFSPIFSVFFFFCLFRYVLYRMRGKVQE